MLKRITFFLLCFIANLITAQESTNLLSWVTQASLIYLRIDGIYEPAPVDNATTVLTLKKRMLWNHGIPVDHQAIHPFGKKWWTLWLLEHHGLALKDNHNIKQIMDKYNTNCFEVVKK